MDLENVPTLGGLDWRGFSRAKPPPVKEKGPKLGKPPINDRGVIKKGGGEIL